MIQIKNENVSRVVVLIVVWIIAIIMIFSFSSIGGSTLKEYTDTVYNPNTSFRAFNNNSCAILTGDCIVSLVSVYNTTNVVGLGNISYCYQSGFNPSYYHGLNITTPQFNNTVLNATFYSGSCQYYGVNPHAWIQITLVWILVLAFALTVTFYVIRNGKMYT